MALFIMKEIKLTQGKVTLVDDEDFDKLNETKWFAQFDDWSCYAKTNSKYVNGKRKGILMHRLIMGVTDPNIKVDHRDKNGLNNQRSNLRVCTNAQNCQNTFSNPGIASKFRGVTKTKRKSSSGIIHEYWIARISVVMERKYLGVFKTEEDAARAYDAAAKIHHREFATLNFP